MFFRPIIERQHDGELNAALGELSRALGLPVKNVRRWWDEDSIPSGYWKRLQAKRLATVTELLDAADKRLAAKVAEKGSAAA